jgi:hypothetical protein
MVLGEKNYSLHFKFRKSWKTKQQNTRIQGLVQNEKKIRTKKIE